MGTPRPSNGWCAGYFGGGLVSGEKRHSEAGPVEIIFLMLAVRAGDYIVAVTAVGAVGFFAVAVDGFWFLVVAVVAAPAWWFLRDWESKRRAVRVFERAWKGTPESPGIALSLGLSNVAGSLPRLRKFETGSGIRTLVFSLPPGVTAESFEKVRPALADAMGGHRCQVEKVAPGQVRVRVIDEDSMKTPRDAGWAKDVVLEEDTFDGLPGETRSWFEQEGPAS